MGRRLFFLLFIIISAFLINSCADAGADKEALSKHKVILDGSNSTPSNGWEITEYKWSQLRGKIVDLHNKNSAKAWFIAPDVANKEKFIFLLTITEKRVF